MPATEGLGLVGLEPSGGSLPALILLACVQGVTEFLPISSSGHLVLAHAWLGGETGGLATDVALHVGTLAAVLWVFRADVALVLREAREGRPLYLLLVAVGSVPAGVAGLLGAGLLERLFHSAQAAGAGLLVTALALFIGERGRNRHHASRMGGAQDPLPGVADAFWIGSAQALAILPGISRSGTTIAVGLARGLSPERAASFSFLLSIPAVAGAALLQLLPALKEEGGIATASLLGAASLAGLVGWGALRVLLATLRRGAFSWFAVYCLVLGLAVLIFV